MADNKNDKGFNVVDRRISSEEEAAPAKPDAATAPAPAAEPAGDGGQTDDAREAYPGTAEEDMPITFPSFLLSLHTSALIHLGIIPDPMSRKKIHDLGMARQNIALLEMLQDKTEGRRTAEETRLLENILYELRLAYVDTVKQQGNKGEIK